MRALLSHSPGGPETLSYDEVAEPKAGRGEVRIVVEACSINYPDVLIIEDRYQFRPERPFAPGGEVTGRIDQVGEGVTGYAKGDRVIALTGWGGLAGKVVVGQDRLLAIPADLDGVMSREHAAAFLMTYGTSWYALKDRGALKAGEQLLVLGAAGGVGSAAVELGKAMGARVIAAVSSEEKRALCLELGADEAVIYPRLDGEPDRQSLKAVSEAFRAASGGRGPDVVYDAVGGPLSEAALRALNWGGRHLVIGFPAGIPAPPLNLTLLKSTAIVGVFWGAHVAREPDLHRANMADLFDLYRRGAIAPRVTQTYRLEQAGEAIAALAARRASGKLVVLMEP
ncbi:MAG: NADPH:quinone oxidoreductase family protein [Brevundimonas sp.]|uniref:NADPH:quinone oxidoreductase family protein n=1 Tax=Brevundimonas sp. TaxID=1871086 RepID=UPI00391B5513